MGEDHERFEALALSHVLGGLPDGDASDLRDHLRACPACRARVAELRELSSDLDAAERDERRRRAAARRRREDAKGTAPDGGPLGAGDGGVGRPSRLRRAVLVVLALATLPLVFWNLHLRSAADAYFATAEERAATLEAFATGRTVEVAGPAGERGRIAIDAARVAIVLVGVGPLGSDERLVAWLEGPGGDGMPAFERHVLAIGPVPEVGVSTLLARGSAERLVLSRERGLLGDAPVGAAIVDEPLDGGALVGP